MKSNNPLKWYAIILTAIALTLLIEVQNLNTQLDEEIELKYEYAVIIDSLLNEKEFIKEYEKERE